MANTVNSRINTFKAYLLFLLVGFACSCTNNTENTDTGKTTPNATNNEATIQSITITGTVKTITAGKDGYIAEVQTNADGVYTALVSIVNLGGREKYQPCNEGDLVTFKGIPANLGGAKHLKVEEIIQISAAPIKDLDSKYSNLKPTSYCWQVNKVMNLHTKPDSGSKVEGKHFQGELLSVLGTQMVENQLWVKVTYKLKVKAGYENQFADGQVMSSGSPTGWIGGAEEPKIECK